MPHNSRHVFLRVTKGMGDVTLRDGLPVLVHDVCVANATGAPIIQRFTDSVESGDVNDVILTITVQPGETTCHGSGWYAAHGFRIPEPIEDVEVTVVYRNKD